MQAHYYKTLVDAAYSIARKDGFSMEVAMLYARRGVNDGTIVIGRKSSKESK